MALARIGALTADTGYDYLNRAFAADHAGTFIYACELSGGSGLIAKISIATFTQVAGLDIPAITGAGGFRDAVIDSTDTFMYVSDAGDAGNLFKIRLSDFTLAATLAMAGMELKALAIDETDAFLYAHDENNSWQKINLSSFTVVGTKTHVAVIFKAVVYSGFLYYVTNDGTGRVYKLDLSDFTTTVYLQTSAGALFTNMVADSTNGILYAKSENTGSDIHCVKIQLSDFTEIGYLVLTGFTAASDRNGFVLDTTNQILYVGNDSSPATIKAINVAPFVVDSSLTLNSGENTSRAMIWVGAFLYSSCNTSPGKIVKMSIVTVPQTPAATDISLRIGFPVTDTDGNSYTYGTTDLGFVKRLENGTTFDGYDIDHEFHTGDILVGGSIFAESFIRNMKLVGVAKTVTGNSISITHYGDSQTSSNAYTMLPTNSGYRIFNKYVEQVFENSIFHSFKATMTTDDETIGFEPLYIGLSWQLVRTS